MKIIKSYIFGIIVFLTLNLVVTILSFFDLMNDNIINIIKTTIFIITFLLSGIFLGFNNKRKILINGLALSSIFIIISVLLILILPNIEFNIRIVLYYLLLIIIINIGNIIGIKIKKAIN